MEELQIILSDTHFGVKNNSKVWLDSQLSFIKNGLIKFIDKFNDKYKITVIHCGDLFDSRTTVNIMIFNKVNFIIREICSKVHEMIVLAGNHDYYLGEPVRENISSLDLLDVPDNCKIISGISEGEGSVIYENEHATFMPWFAFLDKPSLEYVCKGCDLIFTHTDPWHLEDWQKQIITKKNNIVTGHIHQPKFKDNLYGIGSCFAIDFNDANSQRGFYIMKNWDIKTLKLVENKSSIKFWRFKDNDILDDSKVALIRDFDKVEIYIDEDLYNNYDEYRDAIKNINSKCECSVFISHNAIDDNTLEYNDILDFDDIIRDNIPENLKEKFKFLIENYN